MKKKALIKTSTPKLQLSKETLCALTNEELATIQGGATTIAGSICILTMTRSKNVPANCAN